ncbi:Glycerophosphoryl diester phosphodiesterase [uncultured spirochete]|uniref:Glycerophosphoryl diester phosphodiesterase n=1 Tax=uncultured spirochete TaxID=156406 RepID=A0A3P3XNS8_9SPIR|nr:Glycerophosphoryl diester phosphodiesterase [uncultured spirochete]
MMRSRIHHRARKTSRRRTRHKPFFCVLFIFSVGLALCGQNRPENLSMERLIMQPSRPLVIAHRGFRGIAPENTLVAAQKGYDAGADMWELDVAASSDGELVVLHDNTLVRTTDAKARFPARSPWNVYDFTLAELKSLDAGSWYSQTDPFMQIKAGRVKSEELQSFAGIKIPTLREALELTKRLGWRVNIEIKDATGFACDSWIVERTVALVRELDMVSSVLISSFNHVYLRRVKKAAPEIAVAALIDKPIENPVQTLKDIGAIALNPNAQYLDEATVKAVRAAGFGVLSWTVNDPSRMTDLITWGVTGIITDFPDLGLAKTKALH